MLTKKSSSANRCLKITDPSDPVLNRAARESGNPIPDIVENLPTDLAIWIDPGEVSYRIGEKGSVKILYSESEGSSSGSFSGPPPAAGGPAVGGGGLQSAAANAGSQQQPMCQSMPPLSCNTDDMSSNCSSVDPSPNLSSNGSNTGNKRFENAILIIVTMGMKVFLVDTNHFRPTKGTKLISQDYCAKKVRAYFCTICNKIS